MRDKDIPMRAFIFDSLVARSGKPLTPDLINEIGLEILGRMVEIHEVPLYAPAGYLEDMPR